jgi:F-type H+-transporting ATPase subunit gamma
MVGPVKVQIDAYTEGKIGALYVIYTRFINTMKQEPVVEQILPLPADRLKQDERAARKNWDYLYEPDAKAVLEQLLRRYLEQIIYQSVAENIASEQSARMVAMKAASDNASSVIDDLTLVYNKARQAAITKELSEIVSGAAAV